MGPIVNRRELGKHTTEIVNGERPNHTVCELEQVRWNVRLGVMQQHHRRTPVPTLNRLEGSNHGASR